MEIIMAILIGIGLSAAAGFRVFTPLLITSIAEKVSLITLSEGFAWIGSTPALIAFAVATLLEIVSLYIPYFDTIMKNLSGPVATIAGIILTASFIQDIDPLFKWSLAIIAGGGIASVSHFTAATLRTGSTVTTAGFGNIFLSIIEGISAIIMSFSAIFLPFLVILFLLIIIVGFVFIVVTLNRRRHIKRGENG